MKLVATEKAPKALGPYSQGYIYNGVFYAISVVWFFCGSPFGVEPLWPACAGGLGALVVLTLLSPAPGSASYLKYREVKRLGP